MLLANEIIRNTQTSSETNFRKVILFIIMSSILFVNSLVFAQGNWEDNTSNPKAWTTGKVGVGLENPLTLLHIKGMQISDFTGTTRGMMSISGAYTAGYYTPIDFLYRDSANPTARIAAYHDGSGSKLVFGTSKNYASGITNSAVTIDRLGKVGIGTTTPGNTLDVMGGAAFQGNHIYLRNTVSPVNNQTWGMVISSSNGQFNLGPTSDTPPSGGNLSAVPFILQQGAPNYSFVVNSLGNVGIGTPNPRSELAVNGKVTCKEVEVTISGWADFVFADDYQLMPLDKVEQHIQNNKHLPDIPSEREILEDGINLGEMQAKLLQKIEELTLYMITLQKENEELKERVSSLEK